MARSSAARIGLRTWTGSDRCACPSTGTRVWRRCAEVFAATGQRWGATILVDDASSATLPQLLEDLAAAGCHDVSLLNYVGQPAQLLSPHKRRRIAELASTSPLPCRISLCFGSTLDVPRLLAGFDNDGDCGAGSDFIAVTPDQRVQSCSFQDHSFPAATVANLASSMTRYQTDSIPPSRQGVVETVPGFQRARRNAARPARWGRRRAGEVQQAETVASASELFAEARRKGADHKLHAPLRTVMTSSNGGPGQTTRRAAMRSS